MNLDRLINMILIALIICNIYDISYSKYLGVESGIVSYSLAEPIFEVYTQDFFEEELNEESPSKDFWFKISNEYNEVVSDIDFYYTIEIINSNDSFPAIIKLFDENNNEIQLVNNTSSIQRINGRNYKEKLYYIRVQNGSNEWIDCRNSNKCSNKFMAMY